MNSRKLNVVLGAIAIILAGLLVVQNWANLSGKISSPLIGTWKTVKQYQWDSASKEWKPGIILENGTSTDTPATIVTTKFESGFNCGTNALKIFFNPSDTEGSCVTVAGNTFKLENQAGYMFFQWRKLENGNLEIINTNGFKEGEINGIGKAVLEKI